MATKEKTINILLVEDNPGDARLVIEALAETTSGQFELVQVERLSAAMERLGQGGIDVVLLDLLLPDSCGLDTLIRLRQRAPEVPALVLTALDDETLGVLSLWEGAQEYLPKRQMNGDLLVRTIHYAMGRKHMELEQEKLELELQAALAQVKILSGLLPICTSCRKVRDDAGYWDQIANYISKHSAARFTHGMCPECMEQLSPGSSAEQTL